MKILWANDLHLDFAPGEAETLRRQWDALRPEAFLIAGDLGEAQTVRRLATSGSRTACASRRATRCRRGCGRIRTGGMTVICGHMHGGGMARIRPNLLVVTRPARYHEPRLRVPFYVP